MGQSGYDARLLKRHPKTVILAVALLALASWLYWNRPRRVDMATYVPTDSLAFIEANDLGAIAEDMTETEAWRTLAGPVGAPPQLIPSSWTIQLARWTGIGSVESVLVARSQMTIAFMQAEATETESSLTIKPVAALIVETYTSERRMRSPIERYVDQFARRAYGQPIVTRRQVDGVEFAEWSTHDNTRRLVLAIIGTVVVIGNDQSAVLSCVEVQRGQRRSIADDSQLATMRERLGVSRNQVFAFVPKAGVKSAIQAWAFSRARNAADATSIAPVLANAFGNLIQAFAWTSRFDSVSAEDHCRVALAEGVTQQLASGLVPEPLGARLDFSYAPVDTTSITSYHLRNPATFWRDLNTAVSSRSDALTAIASRPLLAALLEPYGIKDPDNFFSAIGPQLQLIRVEDNMPAVLTAEALDMQALRKIAELRIGRRPKVEKLDDAEVLLGPDGWSVAFARNHFLTGTADGVRRCLEAKIQGRSLTTVREFSRTQQSIDVSLPIITLTFANDRSSAISLVELFSQTERPAFSANASAIQQAANNLRYSASVTMMKDDAVEWTSRSSFGIIGSLFTTFTPEKSP